MVDLDPVHFDFSNWSDPSPNFCDMTTTVQAVLYLKVIKLCHRHYTYFLRYDLKVLLVYSF
jgi:hypothetical protein